MSLPLLLALAWALCSCLFTAVTLFRLRTWRRTTAVPPGPLPDVLLLRPLDEPTEQELLNFARPVEYAGALRHVVLSPYRPRLPAHVRWLYSDPPEPNRKVGHLSYALATLARPGEVVVAVDADVVVDGALLAALARPVAAGAALCTAAPEPFGARGLGARAVQALLTSTHQAFIPLHLMSLGARAVCGKALGLGPAAQALLPALGQHLGEDLELSLRLHARGLEVVLAVAPARVPLPEALPLRSAVQRFSRWMRALRAHRPGLLPTVPLLLCPTPLLLCAVLWTGSPWLLGLFLCLIALRTALALSLCREAEGRGRAALDWPLGEGLLLAGFLHALLFRAVAWRGRRFRLLPGGRLLPAVEEP